MEGGGLHQGRVCGRLDQRAAGSPGARVSESVSGCGRLDQQETGVLVLG